MIYMHTLCTRSKGPLLVFKDNFLTFTDNQRGMIQSLHIVNPNSLMKLRVLINGKLCIGKDARHVALVKQNK